MLNVLKFSCPNVRFLSVSLILGRRILPTKEGTAFIKDQWINIEDNKAKDLNTYLIFV